MWDSDHRDAIDGRVLDRGIRHSRRGGFQSVPVKARETKNLPGRKTDVQESQWLMKLHTYGLLRNSFRPPQEIRTMRTYWRQRNDSVQAGARHIQRIQKALTQMNIQLADVLAM